MSTVGQDLTAQRDGLAALGVEAKRVYVDHGLTGTTRLRPGLREALAACRSGDTLVVTKLDRLARSLPDARDIVEELTSRGVRLQLGGSVHDPTDPVGRLLFNVLAMVAEFEADLIKARTREGMAVARAAGKLRGRKPKLTPAREALMVDLHRTGQRTHPTSPSCSASDAPPSTAPCSAPVPRRRRVVRPPRSLAGKRAVASRARAGAAGAGRRRWKVLRPHVQDGVPLTQAARDAQVPLRTAQRWLVRYGAGGLAALARTKRSDLGVRRLPTELVRLVEGLALRRPLPRWRR